MTAAFFIKIVFNAHNQTCNDVRGSGVGFAPIARIFYCKPNSFFRSSTIMRLRFHADDYILLLALFLWDDKISNHGKRHNYKVSFDLIT